MAQRQLSVSCGECFLNKKKIEKKVPPLKYSDTINILICLYVILFKLLIYLHKHYVYDTVS